MSQHKQEDKNTPSDNGQSRSQNSNSTGAENVKTSGATDFDDTQREAFESRESGLNESGNPNRPTRNRDGQEGASEKRAN